MSKFIAYDFSIDTCISVDAERGTDPDKLRDKVLAKLTKLTMKDEITINFETTFDEEFGVYEEDWRIT